MKSILIPKRKCSKEDENNKKEFIIVCDKCGNEFKMKPNFLKKEVVNLRNVNVDLVYLLCPVCHGIYVVSIQDKKYYDLLKDYEKASERLRRAFKRGDSQAAEEIKELVFKKKERLGGYVLKVKKSFPGTFTLTTVKGKDTIIYREK